jgi:hypothetical protein
MPDLYVVMAIFCPRHRFHRAYCLLFTYPSFVPWVDVLGHRYYEFENIFAEKVGVFYSKYCLRKKIIYHNIGFQQRHNFFRRKLRKKGKL